METKLFVTDVDGTLLVTGRPISKKNREAAAKAMARGVAVTIATGRMFPAAKPLADALGVTVPIITYNGALVKSVEGDTIHANLVPKDIVAEICAIGRERKWYTQIYSEGEGIGKLCYPERTEQSELYEKRQGLFGEALGWEGMAEHYGRVPKILFMTNTKEEAEEIRAVMEERFSAVADITQSGPCYVEISNKGVDKAYGIRVLAEYLDIPIAAVMAIGDAENDRAMLLAAGKSVAMGNASEDIKKIATYVTADCAEDGWAQAIYDYALRTL